MYFIVANEWKSATQITKSMLHKNDFPHTQVLGRFIKPQKRASWNSPLGKETPCLVVGKVVNQQDAPRSEAASKACCKCGDKQS